MLARYRERGIAPYFRADAAFAKPELYETLEAEGVRYAIRLPANRVLMARIGHLLTRPVGRPPKKPQVFFASFSYQAQSWAKPRRVVAKVEWHQGELYPRVGFIVTNLTRPAERVVKFYPGFPGWVGRRLALGPDTGSEVRTLAASGRPNRGGRDG